MNSNINFNYDVDYSKDKSIDKRVLEVCAIAEANFLKNLKKTNSRNITDIRDLIINNNNNDNFKIMFANNDTKKALETSRPNVQNRSFFSSSKIGKIGNKSISLEKNLLSQRYYNNNQKNQVNSNFICFKNRLNKQIVNSKNFDQNFSGTKLYLKQNNKLNNENKSFSGISKSQRNFNFRSRMKNQQIERSINLNKKSTIQEELKSNNNFNNFIQTNSSMVRQYKPLFSKTINKSYIFPHIQHIKNKNKYELSKILLKTQNLINRKKYLLAYNLLKEIISTGEYHSDLFYLFGEVNRILKNYQNAENYLLLALNFEIHSPKVFYSMGLLYQELKQYDYSNIFLKLYIRLIDNDNAHYLRAKNYALMGNYLKAAKEMTIAIEMNNECDYYYKFRSEIYSKLGLNEISNEDLNMYNFIKNKKIEENK
jgi:hypothetical protein